MLAEQKRVTITRKYVNESQCKRNNHEQDHGHYNSNRNTVDEAFVISVMMCHNDVFAPKYEANVYGGAFIGTLLQLTRAEMR